MQRPLSMSERCVVWGPSVGSGSGSEARSWCFGKSPLEEWKLGGQPSGGSCNYPSKHIHDSGSDPLLEGVSASLWGCAPTAVLANSSEVWCRDHVVVAPRTDEELFPFPGIAPSSIRNCVMRVLRRSPWLVSNKFTAAGVRCVFVSGVVDN